jgi:hypothetical protein
MEHFKLMSESESDDREEAQTMTKPFVKDVAEADVLYLDFLGGPLSHMIKYSLKGAAVKADVLYVGYFRHSLIGCDIQHWTSGSLFEDEAVPIVVTINGLMGDAHSALDTLIEKRENFDYFPVSIRCIISCTTNFPDGRDLPPHCSSYSTTHCHANRALKDILHQSS